MKVCCRTCDSAFHVSDDSTSELGATAFCPFCGTQIAMQSSVPASMPAPPDPGPSGGGDLHEVRSTSVWDMTKEALGDAVALVAEVDGGPLKLVSLELPKDPNPPEAEDGVGTLAMRRTPLPYVGRTEAFASPGGPAGKPKQATEQLASVKAPNKEMARPLMGAIPTPLSIGALPPSAAPAGAANPGGKPRRQVTGGVELPGLDDIIREARQQEEADIEASAPAPAALAELPPMDPEQNILTSPFVASAQRADHVDLDSMLEDDLPQTRPVPPPPDAVAAPVSAMPSIDGGAQADDPFLVPRQAPVEEPVASPLPETGNELFEIELDVGSAADEPLAAASRLIDLWRVIGEEGGTETKTDILRRIRAGELGPQSRVAASDERNDEQSWPLEEVPEFKRYVMLFGRTGLPADAAKKPFWKRFKRS